MKVQKRRTIKAPRDEAARALHTPQCRQRVIRLRTAYNRKPKHRGSDGTAY